MIAHFLAFHAPPIHNGLALHIMRLVPYPLLIKLALSSRTASFGYWTLELSI